MPIQYEKMRAPSDSELNGFWMQLQKIFENLLHNYCRYKIISGHQKSSPFSQFYRFMWFMQEEILHMGNIHLSTQPEFKALVHPNGV